MPNFTDVELRTVERDDVERVFACREEADYSEPGGRPGKQPPKRTNPVPTAHPGLKGQIANASATLTDIALLLSPSYANAMLSACERDYLNQNFSGALTRLEWLKAALYTVTSITDKERPSNDDLGSGPIKKLA